MFKESLSALASSVSGAARQTVNEYKPTAANMGGAFTRVAQQGIANMSFRSPILADMAATMLHAFQMEMIKRDQIRKYTKTGDAEGLREKIKEELGSKAKDADVDKKMFEILNKMEKLVEVEGDKAKSNELFQKFEKEFDEFKKHFHPEEQDPQLPHGQPGGLGAGGDASLGRIEVNTLHTVQALNELIDKGVGSGGGEGAPSGENASRAPNGSFVDPYTGLPSIKAAVGSIGGSFLAKVFDDATLEKYAKKARSKFFGEDNEEENKPEEPKIEPAKEESASEIMREQAQEVVVNLDKPEPTADDIRRNHAQSSSDLANINAALDRWERLQAEGLRRRDGDKPQLDPHMQNLLGGISSEMGSLDIQKLGETSSINPEQSRESEASSSKHHGKTHSLLTNIIDELKALNEKSSSKSADGVGGILKSLSGSLGSVMSGLSSVARFAMPALAVAGAGAAGYAAGTALNDNVITPAITKMTGKENTLGTWLYDVFNDDPVAEMEANEKAALEAKRKNSGSQIQKLQEEKNSTSASQQTNTPAPQVAAINTTNNNNNTTVVAVASPRNQESSFDRVQQSNFWGRTP